jgi:bifunctional UDP-N-acetylglucosamine pyrophosphorylase/glucosamine-1-phosphate N-acetyltransferase
MSDLSGSSATSGHAGPLGHAAPTDLTVVILAAGGGTRMKSKTVKVLHRVAGRSLVGHVVHAVAALAPRRVITVVGTQAEAVEAHLGELSPELTIARQPVAEPGGPAVRYGTAYAVQVALESAAEAPTGTVLVLNGDTPLITTELLRRFTAEHADSGAVMSILTARTPDPTGYGRIVRDADARVRGIVEEKDAAEEIRRIDEVSSGILAFDAAFLVGALPRIEPNNAKGEYYLTDTVALADDQGGLIGTTCIDDMAQTEGVNDRVQLAAVGAEMNRRIVEEWMRSGVTVMDPATTWIEAEVQLSPDVVLLPGTQLLGASVVAEDAVIGPDTTLSDCEVGAGARVVRTHAELAVIGPHASVGPFSYLRPGAILAEGAKAGAFVEIKNATVGIGAKVPHLSYVGDAEIGDGTNIGAGNIVANYDGVAKHRTVVGKQVRTGANNVLVAPVNIGDGATTGAGTVVRRNVPAGALAVSGGPQRMVEGWTESRRAGTSMARAAQAAREAATDSISHTDPTATGLGDSGAAE